MRLQTGKGNDFPRSHLRTERWDTPISGCQPLGRMCRQGAVHLVLPGVLVPGCVAGSELAPSDNGSHGGGVVRAGRHGSHAPAAVVLVCQSAGDGRHRRAGAHLQPGKWLGMIIRWFLNGFRRDFIVKKDKFVTWRDQSVMAISYLTFCAIIPWSTGPFPFGSGSFLSGESSWEKKTTTVCHNFETSAKSEEPKSRPDRWLVWTQWEVMSHFWARFGVLLMRPELEDSHARHLGQSNLRISL